MEKTKEMKTFVSQKGISLVALIITIIVMVILAGIIIVSAVADGGIIDRAQTALIEQERAEAQDIIETSYVFKPIASQTTYGYLDMLETAKAIFNNLTDAGFKLKKSDGTEATKWEDIYLGGDTLELNIKGKRSEYKGTVKEKIGLEKDLEEIGGGKQPDPIPPVPPEYSNEAVWETDGNGTIIKYLGTEQSSEIQRIEDEFDDGKSLVEVKKIFGDKQQIVEQWVEGYGKAIELQNEIDAQGDDYFSNTMPILYAMMEGESYDEDTYGEYVEPIGNYLQGNADRPNNLPEELDKELAKYEEIMKIMNFETPEEIEEIKDTKYQENLTIPSVYKGETIKTIGDGTENSQLLYSLSVVGQAKNIIIEEGIEKINSNAFSGGYNIEKVSLPSTLKTIESKAFYQSKIKEIDRLENVENLGQSVFESCDNLVSVNTSILGDRMFADCDKLSEVIISSNITTVPNECFYLCTSLKNIILPDSITIINTGAFQESGLTNINMPNSLSTLKQKAFYGCTKLLEITIPNHVTIAEMDVFSNCSNLVLNVYFKKSNTPSDFSSSWANNVKKIIYKSDIYSSLSLTTNGQEIFTSDFVSIYGNVGTTQVQNLAELAYKSGEYSLQISNDRTDTMGSTYLVHVKYYKNEELISSYTLRGPSGYFTDDGISEWCHGYSHYSKGWTDKTIITGTCSDCNGSIYGVLSESEYPVFSGEWVIDFEESNDYGLEYLSGVLVEKK